MNITNDQIEKGPMAENQTIISYGEEGNIAANSSLTVSGTLIENDLEHFSPTGLVNDAGITAALTNLDIYGLPPSQLYVGGATLTGITYLSTEPVISTAHPFDALRAGKARPSPTGNAATIMQGLRF